MNVNRILLAAGAAALLATGLVVLFHSDIATPPTPPPELSDPERTMAGLPLQHQLTLATPADVLYTSTVPRNALDAVKAYLALKHPGVEWRIDAARPVKGHLLLWISFPKIMDGGTDLVYSTERRTIVGTFLGGYRG